MTPPEPLAERKRQLVRDELADCAMKLFAFRGFEETTIDQIAEAAGVSRRTFFRYYQSKEDVIVEFLAHLGTKLRTRLADRPADEPPSVALRRTFEVFVETYDEHSEKSLRIARLTLRTPALLGRYLERQAQWRDELAAELAARTGRSPDDLWARVAAGVALSVFDTAMTRWVDTEAAEPLPAVVSEAFALVAPTLDAAPAPTR